MIFLERCARLASLMYARSARSSSPVAACLARASALSFPSTPRCDGVQRMVMSLPRDLSSLDAVIASLARAWAGPHSSCSSRNIAACESEKTV